MIHREKREQNMSCFIREIAFPEMWITVVWVILTDSYDGSRFSDALQLLVREEPCFFALTKQFSYVCLTPATLFFHVQGITFSTADERKLKQGHFKRRRKARMLVP